jgi:hypothetical protein
VHDFRCVRQINHAQALLLIRDPAEANIAIALSYAVSPALAD